MAATATYASTAFSTADASSYTFTGQGIGTASSSRLVVVSIHTRRASSTTSAISGVTIGGNSATVVVTHTNTSGGNITITALAVLLVTSGTTADIVVTFNETMARCAIGVWAVTGADATPEATYTTNTGGVDNNISVDAGRCVISAVCESFPTAAFTWSALTERFDTIDEGFNVSGADATLASANSALNLRTNHASGVNIRSQVAAVFEPAAATSNGAYYRYLLGH